MATYGKYDQKKYNNFESRSVCQKSLPCGTNISLVFTSLSDFFSHLHWHDLEFAYKFCFNLKYAYFITDSPSLLYHQPADSVAGDVRVLRLRKSFLGDEYLQTGVGSLWPGTAPRIRIWRHILLQNLTKKERLRNSWPEHCSTLLNVHRLKICYHWLH